MVPASRLALLAALAAACAVSGPLPPQARAEDDPPAGGGGGGGGEGDGEEGAEGGDAAPPPVAPPTLDDGIEVGDPKRLLAIRAPRSWATPERFEPTDDLLAVYTGMITTTAPGAVELRVRRLYARASMALAQRLGGDAIAEEARSGPGWVEGATTFPVRGGRLVAWCRAVEKEGRVYLAEVRTPEKARESARDLARRMLDTFQVKGALPKFAPPAGVASSKSGEFDLWTADKKVAGKIAEQAGEARAAVAKLLKGKPFDEARPVIEAYEGGTVYMERATSWYGEAPKCCYLDPESRSILAQLHRVTDDEFPARIRQCAARQYLFQYFGGPPPTWIDWGLRWYGTFVAEAGGKTDKIGPGYIDTARRAAVGATKRLDEWLDADVPTTDDLDSQKNKDALQGYELFAWHMFFRMTGGKKYAKNYQAYLDALRATGDPAAARKAWDGVDFAAMLEEFKEFGGKWK